MSTPFVKPTEEQVVQWYEWAMGLRNNKKPPNDKENPFDPTDEGRSWDANNNNESNGSIIWLAGITATTEPAYKPSEIPNLQAIVAGSGGKIVYNDGKGNPVRNMPTILKRTIPGTSENKIGKNDIYIPVSTELATAKKYPKVEHMLGEVARGIIDHEEDKIPPPAFVNFVDANGNKIALSGLEVQQGYRINSTKDIQFDLASMDNVFMLPPGQGAAAFSDYAVILKGDALKPGPNELEFGVDARHFKYSVKYTINI